VGFDVVGDRLEVEFEFVLDIGCDWNKGVEEVFGDGVGGVLFDSLF